MPTPVSRTVRAAVLAIRLEASTRDLALEGELEGVGEQIEDDLLPHVAVDVDSPPEQGGQSMTRLSPALSIAERKLLARSRRQRGEIGRARKFACGAPRFDAREIEQAS